MSGLVEVELPFNAFVFIKTVIGFASMDVFSSEDMYEEIFKFKDTDPVSQKFDFNGIGDKNAINNSGPYYVMLIILFVTTFFYYFVNNLMRCCYKCKCAR